jgi:hypothetical protein
MILVVAQHHPLQPLPGGLYRLVHPSAQLLLDLLELGPHPLPGRFLRIPGEGEKDSGVNVKSVPG